MLRFSTVQVEARRCVVCGFAGLDQRSGQSARRELATAEALERCWKVRSLENLEMPFNSQHIVVRVRHALQVERSASPCCGQRPTTRAARDVTRASPTGGSLPRRL